MSESESDTIYILKDNAVKRKKKMCKKTIHPLKKKKQVESDKSDYSSSEIFSESTSETSIISSESSSSSSCQPFTITTKPILKPKPKTPEEIIRSNVSGVYKWLCKIIKTKDITIEKIICSKLPFSKMVYAIEMFHIYENEAKHTQQKLTYRNFLNNLLTQNNLTAGDLKILQRIQFINNDNQSLQQKILRSSHSNSVKAIIYRKFKETDNLKKSDDERFKMNLWVTRALKVPTKSIDLKDIFPTSTQLINNVYSHIEKNIYGQHKIKEKILSFVASIWNNQNAKGNNLVFVGPPGVGKTVFARSLAKGIGLPFYQISFGGRNNSSFLKGHSTTYVGSKPGEIYNALAHMGVKNGILYLDELDKIQNNDKGAELSASLLHILDPSQNDDFRDNYISDIPLDLSKLIIIASVNDINFIDSILRNRLNLVRFADYSRIDKVNIGLNYSVPKIIKELCFNEGDIIVTKENIKHILNKSQIDEKGIRHLERNIRNIFEKINVLKHLDKRKSALKLSYQIKNFKLPFVLSNKNIDKLFDEYNPNRKTFYDMFA